MHFFELAYAVKQIQTFVFSVYFIVTFISTGSCSMATKCVVLLQKKCFSKDAFSTVNYIHIK